MKFNSMHERVFVSEPAADEFTFDNKWPDGTPKLSRQKEKLFHPRQGSCRRHWWRSLEDEVSAHAHALDLMRGREVPYGEARVMCHDGRRPWFSKASGWGFHPEGPADEHYELAEGELDEAALPG